MTKKLILIVCLLSIQFAKAQPANIDISNGLLFNGEPFIAINPVNNQNLVAAWMSLNFSGGLFQITIKTRASFDSGNTWNAQQLLPHFGAAYGSADVSMAYDKTGLLYICYIDYRQQPDSGGIYVARSINGGLSWDTPSKAFDMYDVANKRPIDRPWLVVDNSSTLNSGTLYITTKPAPWIAPPNRNYFKTSSDSGHTWTPIANVDGGNFLIGNFVAAPMATPATTVNGKFCAVYPSYVATQNPLPALYLAQSNDKGQTFNYTTLFASANATLDTNCKNGYLLIAHPADSTKMLFVTPDAHNGDADISAFNTIDGGQTWTGPVRVNDDAINNGKTQDMVWASYNENGDIAVTWRDRRNAPANGFWNAGYDFYYALSYDNGQTFSANQKLSNQFIDFDSVLTQNGNDFMSCVFRGDTLYTVWGDTRNGKMNIYFSKTIASTNTNVGIWLLNEEKNNWYIFPNPATEELNLITDASETGDEIFIYDTNGKTFWAGKVTSPHMHIQLNKFANGTYYLKTGKQLKSFIKR